MIGKMSHYMALADAAQKAASRKGLGAEIAITKAEIS